MRAQLDLAIISVLLDAGAGPTWRYREPGTIDDYRRSEGLGVATICAFIAGAFSASPCEPMRVDAAALSDIDAATLGRWFQVSADNPLVGLDGRAALLRRLGDILETRPDRFGLTSRPCALFDPILGNRTLSAPAILRAILEGFGPIWRANPGQGDEWATRIHGDVWRHRHAGGNGPMAGFVPFHKLSQWLAYSLFAVRMGRLLSHRPRPTALPEYRNGGLLIDTGVLQLINDADSTVWDVGSEIIVEWRALTVALLDDLASRCAPSCFRACPCVRARRWRVGDRREFANKLRRGDPARRTVGRHGF